MIGLGEAMGTIIEPNLTTVSQPIEELGSNGMSILIRKLNGEPATAERTILQTRLIVRESYGYK